MNDGRWYLANILFLLGFLIREVLDSIVVSSQDNDWVFATNSNLISEWLAMSGFSCFIGENFFVFDPVWEWRGDCAWRGCLVTRICTYT